MNLIIFDIDGTLTQTNQVDSDCFARAVKEALNIQMLNTDWSSYRYSTDSGLLNEIYQAFLQRLPTNNEINLIQKRFITYLQQAWLEDQTLFTQAPGADAIFSEVASLTHWQIALATGAWQSSALFKLEKSHIPHENLPKAYSDDQIERTEIIQIAIQKAKTHYVTTEYKRIIYIGDQLWDERAAAQLNIEFIGVGKTFSYQPHRQRLVVQDYLSNADLLAYLRTQ